MTKMKKNLNYEVFVDCMHQTPQGLMQYREQVVVFRKNGINHIARIITYADIKKGMKPKLISFINMEKFLNNPDVDLKIMLAEASEAPPEEDEN